MKKRTYKQKYQAEFRRRKRAEANAEIQGRACFDYIQRLRQIHSVVQFGTGDVKARIFEITNEVFLTEDEVIVEV